MWIRSLREDPKLETADDRILLHICQVILHTDDFSFAGILIDYSM